MKIVTANINDFDDVRWITETTITAVYPHYYPAGAVEFFCRHHSDDKIKADIDAGCVYLLEDEGRIVGTVTVSGNHINRLFVLPECQHKGDRTGCVFPCKEDLPEARLQGDRIPQHRDR